MEQNDNLAEGLPTIRAMPAFGLTTRAKTNILHTLSRAHWSLMAKFFEEVPFPVGCWGFSKRPCKCCSFQPGCCGPGTGIERQSRGSDGNSAWSGRRAGSACWVRAHLGTGQAETGALRLGREQQQRSWEESYRKQNFSVFLFNFYPHEGYTSLTAINCPIT